MKFILKTALPLAAIILFTASCSKTSTSGNNNTGGGGGGGTITIDSISPSSGISGTLVTIYSKQFNAASSGDTIKVNGKQVKLTDASSGAITFNVPTGLGSGIVDVITGGKTYTGPNFTYITSAVISLYAGGAGQGDLDGALLTGQFNTPRGLAIDMNDNVYVADNFRVRKVTTNGTISTIAGQTTSGINDGGALSGAQFEQVMTLACNPAGDHIYIADNGSIRLLTGGSVSTIAGSDVYNGIRYMDGSGSTARFNEDITGLWLNNTTNNIYAADAINGRIRVVTTGGSVTTLAGNGDYGTGGTGINAAFGNMNSLTGDGLGSLFLLQIGGGSEWLLPASGTPVTGVLRVTESGGKVSTLAGSTNLSVSTDGDTTNATFYSGGFFSGVTLSILGMAYDKTNKILYVSYGPYGIRAINLTTGKVSTILPTPDTRTTGVNLINGSNTSIGTMVEDSKGDLIVCDGSWLYKVQFGQ